MAALERISILFAQRYIAGSGVLCTETIRQNKRKGKTEQRRCARDGGGWERTREKGEEGPKEHQVMSSWGDTALDMRRHDDDGKQHGTGGG